MKYNGVLIAVSDMENSRRFYSDVLGLKVVEDFGANVTLEGGIFLQTLDTWKTFIQSDQVVLPNHAGVCLHHAVCGAERLSRSWTGPGMLHRWYLEQGIGRRLVDRDPIAG